MANEEYQVGDKVTILSGAAQDESSLGATIVRRMTDADDYEVEYDEEQLGVSPIVHPDRLLLAARAKQAKQAKQAPAAETDASGT